MQLRSQQEEARWPKLPSCSQQEVVRWPELPSCSLREAGRKPCEVQRALSAFHGVRRASEATSATEAEAARAAMGQRMVAAALKQASKGSEVGPNNQVRCEELGRATQEPRCADRQRRDVSIEREIFIN